MRYTLPKFNSEFAPKKLPKPKKKVLSTHHFSGVNSLLNLGGVMAIDSDHTVDLTSEDGFGREIYLRNSHKDCLKPSYTCFFYQKVHKK